MRRTLLTLALAAGIAGCGGKDRMSVEDYRAELRRICTDSERQTQTIRAPVRPTPDAITDYLARLRDVNKKTTERVDALEPPEDFEDAHDRAIAANRTGQEKLDEVIDEIEGGGDSVAALRAVGDDLRRVRDEARRAARDIGVRECER